MTAEAIQVEDAAVPVPDHQAAPSVEPSILGELRALRTKNGSGAEPIFLPVPGYDGKLVLRFRWVPFKELSATAQQLHKIREPTAQAVAASADALVATCDEVLYRADPSTDIKKSDPLSTNEIPIDFSDPRLAYALGFEKADSAREQCYRAFNNEYALIDVAHKVTTWLEDTSREVDAEYLGE